MTASWTPCGTLAFGIPWTDARGFSLSTCPTALLDIACGVVETSRGESPEIRARCFCSMLNDLGKCPHVCFFRFLAGDEALHEEFADASGQEFGPVEESKQHWASVKERSKVVEPVLGRSVRNTKAAEPTPDLPVRHAQGTEPVPDPFVRNTENMEPVRGFLACATKCTEHVRDNCVVHRRHEARSVPPLWNTDLEAWNPALATLWAISHVRPDEPRK